MPEKNVVIYTTPSCPYCKLAKALFKENNVAYKEMDVALNEKAAEEMIAKSGQMGVPVIEIDGQIVVGFNKPKLLELLSK